MPVPTIIGPAPTATPQAYVATQAQSTAIGGPYLSSNTNYYQIVAATSDGSSFDIGLAKSTDGGNTYPTIVTLAGVTTRAQGYLSVFYRGSGDIIDIAYTVTTGPSAYDFYTITCDINAETFGTPNHTPLSFIPASASPLDWLLAVNGAGEQVLCYDINNNTGTAASVYAIRYTSGSWSSAILISGATTLAFFDQVLVDGNGNVRILWSDWQAGGPSPYPVKRNAMYETLLTGGTVTATYTAFADATHVNNKGYGDYNVKPGAYDATNDLLAWPISKQTLDGGGNITAFEQGVLVCANCNSAPAYSYYTAWSASGPSYVIGWPSLALKSDGSEISLLWAEDARVDDSKPNGLTLRRVTAPIATGAWSGLVTFYDPAVDPPVPTINWNGSVMFFTWSRYVGASEAFAAQVDFSTHDGVAVGFSPFNFPVAGTSLRLVKSVSGGTALPAMWLLTGTGPSPISAAGDTGVVPVDPGTYALTESVGPDGYTASDWVCSGGMQSGASVTIATNDTVVCTITNTFGTPPFKATCPSPIIVLGVPYSSFVSVTGGTPPYTFAVHSGSLPTGLSLNASTGEISGTPSAAGPFTFTIRVTDSLAATADTPNCPAGRCTGTVSII